MMNKHKLLYCSLNQGPADAQLLESTSISTEI